MKHKSAYAKAGFGIPVKMYFTMLDAECTTVITHGMEGFFCCDRKGRHGEEQ